jgi:hypothetical protein
MSRDGNEALRGVPANSDNFDGNLHRGLLVYFQIILNRLRALVKPRRR